MYFHVVSTVYSEINFASSPYPPLSSGCASGSFLLELTHDVQRGRCRARISVCERYIRDTDLRKHHLSNFGPQKPTFAEPTFRPIFWCAGQLLCSPTARPAAWRHMPTCTLFLAPPVPKRSQLNCIATRHELTTFRRLTNSPRAPLTGRAGQFSSCTSRAKRVENTIPQSRAAHPMPAANKTSASWDCRMAVASLASASTGCDLV